MLIFPPRQINKYFHQDADIPSFHFSILHMVWGHFSFKYIDIRLNWYIKEIKKIKKKEEGMAKLFYGSIGTLGTADICMYIF